jgi:Protein  of unknown function (DUF3018)
MEQMPHTGKLESKRTDAPTFDEGRAGNANARYEFVHLPQYAPTYAGQGLICISNALRWNALEMEKHMALAADRMKAMRERRRARGLRELRLIVPDARSKAVRRRIAKEVAGLDQSREFDAIGWIEAVSESDAVNESAG